ncbi:MAG: NAD(P)-dependent oxidoreductase, partial [Myxococcales bacterium]
MTNPTGPRPHDAVTVIGLGAMGATLARLFVQRGRRVTVWNRTADRATDLVAQGATLAPSPAAALQASPLVVVCLYDYAASDAVWRSPGVDAALAGRTVVQLTTGSPADARRSLDWARSRGAAYLDGAIQAAPGQMGQPDTPVLLSGDAAVHARVAPLLADLAGAITYLGDAIDAAATMDLATLSYV